MNLLKVFRFKAWWPIIIPQVLGWIYFCLLIESPPISSIVYKASLFFVSLISISSFGYLFNDYWDQETDSIAGKPNLLIGQKKVVKISLVLVPLLLGVISWWLISANWIANTFFALQVVALVLYSMPPFRFKTRAELGIIADAFYGHVNPILITLAAFSFLNTLKPSNFLLVVVIFICASLKGMRNILLHQLHDRKKDLRSNLQTFVLKNDGMYTLTLINNFLPFEILCTLLMAVVISVYLPPFLLSILLFSVLTYFSFSGWKLSYLPKRQLRFKFLYFLNDYYEEWVPVFFLILLSIREPQFMLLLILHLVLFPSFLIKLWNIPRIVKQNLKTEEDY
jgi:4-hydroxybenzoate polyprenyltransferase